MVARSPPKQLRRQVAAPNLSLTHIRETVKKVDQCMARLQELQHTVRGGKREPLRMKTTNSRKSPNGKLRTIPDEWHRMSLPAMLLGETLGEILQASQFAKNIAEAVSKNTNTTTTSPLPDDPRTPITERRKPKPSLGTNSTGLRSRRKREKRVALQAVRSENGAPNLLPRAKSKINFKASSPVYNRECERNRPCVMFSKTKSPVVVARKRQTPHKFLIKSPILSTSPKKEPMVSNVKQLRGSFSPLGLGNRFASPFKSRKLVTPHKFLIKSPHQRFPVKIKSSPPRALSAAGKLRRSLSPARLANRLMMMSSPLRSRKLGHQNEAAEMRFTSGVEKKRSADSSVKFSPRRI